MNLNKDDIVTLTEIGTGKNIFIFSPVFPFSHKVFEKISDFLSPNTKFIFSDLNTINKFKPSFYSLQTFLDFYINLVDKIESDSKIYLVGFGVFSIVFSKLINILNERISFLFFIEPDFSNSVLAKLFDSENRPLFKFKFLIEYYIRKDKEKNINILKKDLKYLKFFYYNIKEYLQSNKVLKDLIKYKDKIKIFWKVMAKETWPLPQVLIEEYEFHAFLLEKNVPECLFQTEGVLFNEIKDSLN